MGRAIERAAMFAAAEFALFATDLMARRNLNGPKQAPGLPGTIRAAGRMGRVPGATTPPHMGRGLSSTGCGRRNGAGRPAGLHVAPALAA